MSQPAAKTFGYLDQARFRSSTRAWPIQPTSLKFWLVGVAICAALVLRFNAGLTRDLWEDEILAATHAEQPFWRLPVEVARFDFHPFLYFMQLHAWSLIGASDLWLRLNSILWNLIAIGSMFLVTHRLYGRDTAWVAAPLFALSAPVVWMSQELRPYSWLYCLLIWSFYFVERSFGKDRGGLGCRAACLGLCLAVVYSHALGFLAVFLLGLYALGRIIEARLIRRDLAIWAVLFGICAVSAVLPLAEGLLRDANMGSKGVLPDLLDWIPRLVLPRGDVPALLAAASIVFVGTVACGLATRALRLMTAIFLVAPILIAMLVDAVHMQIFKPNVFSTFVTPFLIIVLARLIAWRPERQRWMFAAAFGFVFALFSTEFFVHRAPTTGFRAASDLVRAQARPDDIVYAPQLSMFWGMARYMGVGRQAWQLQVAPALTPQWRRMFDRLGPHFVSAFDLEPRTQTLVMPSGPPLLVGNSSVETAARAHRVWLVTYERSDLPPGFPPASIGDLKPVATHAIGFLRVGLYQ